MWPLRKCSQSCQVSKSNGRSNKFELENPPECCKIQCHTKGNEAQGELLTIRIKRVTINRVCIQFPMFEKCIEPHLVGLRAKLVG